MRPVIYQLEALTEGDFITQWQNGAAFRFASPHAGGRSLTQEQYQQLGASPSRVYVNRQLVDWKDEIHPPVPYRHVPLHLRKQETI